MKGVDIVHTSTRKSVASVNYRLVVEHSKVVIDYLASEVTLRRKVGPFSQLPFSKILGSLMGTVIKKYL